MSEMEDEKEILDERLKRVVNWVIISFKDALDYECFIKHPEWSIFLAHDVGLPIQAVYGAIDSLKSLLSGIGTDVGLASYRVWGEIDLGNMFTVFLDMISDGGKEVQVQLKIDVIMEVWDEI